MRVYIVYYSNGARYLEDKEEYVYKIFSKAYDAYECVYYKTKELEIEDVPFFLDPSYYVVEMKVEEGL